MATRTRFRSHSPTPSPTHSLDQPQPLTTVSTLGSMTLDTRGSQENIYGGRNDHTLPSFSRNLVIGTGAPHSPRNSNYTQTYPISPPKDAKNYPRSNRPTLIPENDQIARERHHYNYDDSSYSEFAQSKPSVNMQDSEAHAHRQLPSLGNSQFANGSRSLPPPNQSTYQPGYSTSLDAHKQRQLSINSIISSPGVSKPNSTLNSFGTVAHGNGTMKKRKKSFGTENEGEQDNIDSDDRDRDGGQVRNGDGCGSGANKAYKSHTRSVGLEDPDVRLAAEALGDLRADLNHSIPNARQNLLQLSTASSSNSSTTNTGVNSPLSPSQPSGQYTTHLNPEDAPLLDLIQNNPNPVLRVASAAGRFSAAAYTTSKTLSPRFKYAAEHVESVAKGRLGGAVGDLVSTVGKRSGLEGFVRRSLATSTGPFEDGKSSPDISQDNRRLPPITNGTAKKRKTSGENMEGNGGMSSTSSNLGDIPEERQALQKQQQDNQQQNWQTRLILSTSGISVMSEESLKSLRFCLEWLRWANNHLGKCIETLKTVLEEYEANNKSMGSSTNGSSQNPQANGSISTDGSGVVTMRNQEQTEERKQMLMGRIERLKGEVLKTLKKVVGIVDSYAGGALVGETRNMVKRQLLHLPQRLQIALVAHNPEDQEQPSGSVIDPTAAAQRVIIVAKEGLDMMHNVSRLVEFALVSAEEWCEKLGRKRGEPEEKNSNGGDIKMVEAGQESPSYTSEAAAHEDEKTQQQLMMTENGEKRDRDSEGDVKMES